jgi:hypothetical protein
MIAQVNLEGKRANPEWKGICCKLCWNAEHEICHCRCKGKYHGHGHKKEKSSSEQ